MSNLRLIMIGAMYENGGNTTHRFLDGHPELFTYPFESQLGTHLCTDHLSGMFPQKYRWPAFRLDATPEQDYRMIIDEEGKVRALTPHVSKFRHAAFEMSNADRQEHYLKYVQQTGRSRAHNVAAFFQATFDAWKNFARTGRETTYLGYSPILGVDADKVLGDMPNAHFIHVVRNPWSAYADTKKRPVPLSLHHYMLGWTLNQYHALLFRDRFKGRFHIVRIEDVFADSSGTLGKLSEKMGLSRAELTQPTWNRAPLPEVYPWGTIRKPTPEANVQTAKELTPAEQSEVRAYTSQYLETFDYSRFL